MGEDRMSPAAQLDQSSKETPRCSPFGSVQPGIQSPPSPPLLHTPAATTSPRLNQRGAINQPNGRRGVLSSTCGSDSPTTLDVSLDTCEYIAVI